MSSHSLLLVLSAPSGGGKTTVCQGLMDSCPQLVRAVTCTTRPALTGEQDGVDYYFLHEDSFRSRVKSGDFLEHANVYGNLYGTLKEEVRAKLDKGLDVLLAVDVQGAAAIREQAQTDDCLSQALITLFLAPPSIQELASRLQKRNQDAPEIIQKRLSHAREEIEQAQHFDYVVVSDTPSEDLRRILRIIEAEKLKQHRINLPSYDE